MALRGGKRDPYGDDIYGTERRPRTGKYRDYGGRFGSGSFSVTGFIRRGGFKRMLAAAGIAVLLLLLLVLFIASKLRLIDKPKEGDKKAALYNANPIAEEAKLLNVPASFTKLSDPAVYSVKEYMRIDGKEMDGYRRQADADFTGTPKTVGTGPISDGKFSTTWEFSVGTANGVTKNLDWRGRALVVTWDELALSRTNVYEAKRSNGSLTEVIYACTDGNVYFIDLADGTPTRQAVNLKMPITGTGAVNTDIPMFVVGTGDCTSSDKTSLTAISLLDCEVIANFGARSNFAENMPDEKYDFSAEPLISTDGKNLIAKGENGVIYSYAVTGDTVEGKSVVKLSQALEYTYSAEKDGKSYCSEGVAGMAGWKNYIYTGDDKGNLVCIDANTMKLIWIRNLGEKISAAPVLEEDPESGTVYVYVGTSVDREEGKLHKATVFISKLNAATGDIIWQRNYKDVYVTKRSDGGIVSPGVLGEGVLSEYIFFYIAGEGGRKHGRLLAVNKKTGGVFYSVDTRYYSLGGPAVVYSDSGSAYLVLADCDGNLFLLDAKKGDCLDTRKTGERITTEPTVYGNTVIIGSEKKIYGISIE